MNEAPQKIFVKIIVFPTGIDLTKDINFDENIYGKEFSDLQDIKINEVVDGYSVLYDDTLFPQLDIYTFADNIIETFGSQLTDYAVKIELYYIHMNMINSECGKELTKLNNYLYFEDMDCPYDNIEYCETSNIEYIIDMFDDIDDSDDDDDDIFDFSDKVEYDDSPSRKKTYRRSRLMRSKNAKRDINRHNFLISSDKKAKKNDEKIIKEFLKDFIPGNKKHIKQYRATLLERWMVMFVMSKKQAKRMADNHKKKNRKGSIISKNGLVSLAEQLVDSYDPWYDSNK